MPQLAVETFPSQIFWILVGFAIVYFFMARVVTPNIQETLRNRSAHIDELLSAARQLSSEAEKLEKTAAANLENAEMESVAAEAELMTKFRERSVKEKEELYELYSDKSKQESASISKSAHETFREISEHMDEILDSAVKSISASVGENK